MKLIDEGEFFQFNTDKQKQAFKNLMKTLRKGKSLDKGRAAKRLHENEIYTQKQDCKDFVKNIIRARNTEVVSVGRRKIALNKTKSVVTTE